MTAKENGTTQPNLAVLSNQLQHVETEVVGISKKIDSFLNKLEKQNERTIIIEQKVEYHSKEIKENKEEHEKEIEKFKLAQDQSKNTIWDEIRRKDKNVKWFVTTGIGFAVLILAALKYFG